MKHLTSVLFSGIAAGMVLLCTACSEQPQEIQDTTEDSEISYISEYETIVPVDEQAFTEMPVHSEANNSELVNDPIADSELYGFRSAVWLAKDAAADTERYFMFYDDHTGKYLDQETGLGQEFTCELDAAQGQFYFGGTDTGKTCTFVWIDEDMVSIKWDDGKIESLTYLRDQGTEELHFYSNEELCTMALDHYEEKTGYRPSMAGAVINLDEMIAIQLYDLVDDHISTSDWYTVDRYTAEGYNDLSEPIALAGSAAEENVPGETIPETESMPASETIPGETEMPESVPAV